MSRGWLLVFCFVRQKMPERTTLTHYKLRCWRESVTLFSSASLACSHEHDVAESETDPDRWDLVPVLPVVTLASVWSPFAWSYVAELVSSQWPPVANSVRCNHGNTCGCERENESNEDEQRSSCTVNMRVNFYGIYFSKIFITHKCSRSKCWLTPFNSIKNQFVVDISVDWAEGVKTVVVGTCSY